MAQLKSEQISLLSSQLSEMPELRLPAKMAKDGCSQQEKQKYLNALLHHDPGVFLERHGSMLNKQQREYFTPLREDYEVNFYMMMLEDAVKAETTGDVNMTGQQEGPSLSAKTKNRRLAKMARLDKEGFFEEDTARKRAPLLHHQYLGQYAPARPPISASTLSDQIIQQHEERQIAEKMLKEQQMETQAQQAFEATLSESESDSDEEIEDDVVMTNKPGHDPPNGKPISAEELAQNQIDFKTLMEARFLSGQDGGADADSDSELDDDWEKERRQDLEDDYFGE